jgi:hypothetical protein
MGSSPNLWALITNSPGEPHGCLIEQWRAIREGRPLPRPLTKETASTAKEYPAGSIGAAWQDWIRTPEWRALADSTRTKIWWPAWLKRIEPVFGDCAPDSVTMDLLSDWRATVEATTGLDAAHKALKVWRALWRVMQALRYTQLTDPSEKVRTRISREHLGQQFHGGVDEVVPQISRFRHQAGRVRAVDYQCYLRRDAGGITNAQPGDDRCEPGPHFLLVGPSGDPAGMVLVGKLCRQVQERTAAIGGTPDPPRDFR